MRSPFVLMSECGDDIEIRGLDGERKALVYDNYSKLIAATETIRKVSPFDFSWIGKRERDGTAFEFP